MPDALNGRTLYRPRRHDPDEDLSALADAIAAALPELIDRDGRVMLHQDGQRIPVTRDVLAARITENVVVLQEVNIGTAEAPYLELKYVAYVPTEKELKALLAAPSTDRTLRPHLDKGGSLLARVARV